MKTIKKHRKLISIMLSLILIFNTSASVPFTIFAETAKTYEYTGYTVEYTIQNEWAGNQSVEVKITNTGAESIPSWAVAYNAGGEISGLWNAFVHEQNDTRYIIKNAGYNYEIEPNQSVNFGYTLSGENLVAPESFEIVSKRIDITDGYDVQFKVTNDWGTGFQSEITITNTSETPLEAWMLSFDSNFTIDNLWNGRIIEQSEGYYAVSSEMWSNPIQPGNSVTIGFAGTKSADDSAVAENFSLSAVVVDETPIDDIDWEDETDTDEDGLPDVYEIHIYGTDPENPDTDGDELPDGYEVFVLGTDPLKADTDDNDISDADEDFDEDGLSNLEEYLLETDPFSDDTDYDKLSDYDEIYVYNTDPLKYDTDDDYVSDGDEIELGLNPNNPATNGIPDGERTFEQTLSEDDASLSYVNSLDTPFTVSLDIKSAGVAGNNLSAGESGYSYQILQNEAVLGIVPEFTYSDGLSIDDVIISFNLDSSVIPNELGVYADEEEFQGINRFNVFKYFEDNNILLPIETFHDAANNRVYTHVDELGTYCLIDMEKWVNYLENLPEGDYFEGDNNAENEGSNPPANIVFCIDTREVNSDLESVKENVKDISEWALETYSDVRIYIYTQNCTSAGKVQNVPIQASVNGETKDYFQTIEGVEKAIEYVAKYDNGSMYDFVEATRFMTEKCDSFDNRIIAMYHIVAAENVIGEISEAKELSSMVRDNVGRIYVSTICPLGSDEVGKLAYASQLAMISDGIVFANGGLLEVETQDLQAFNSVAEPMTMSLNSGKDEYGENVEAHVILVLGVGRKQKRFPILSATGIKHIELEYTIGEYYSIFGMVKDHAPIQSQLIPVKSADKDGDSLMDYEEIDFESKLLKFEGDKVTLPTIQDCIDYYAKEKKLTYVEMGLYRYKINYSTGSAISHKSFEEHCKEIYILPINSDPSDVDSDGDEIVDSIKYFDSDVYKKLNAKDKAEYQVTVFSDPYPLKHDYLWQWPLLDTSGNKVPRISSGFYEKREHKYENGTKWYDNHAAIDISTTIENEDGTQENRSGLPVVAAYDGVLSYIGELSNAGCSIKIEHSINGKTYTSRYIHMAYYDGDNENHEFIQYIKDILESRGKNETFFKSNSDDDNYVWGNTKSEFIKSLNIKVKADTPIGIAAGTSSSTNRNRYDKHLDFRIDDEDGMIINPLSFKKSLDSSKNTIKSYDINMYMNVPKKLYNVCTDSGCGCKDEKESGEMNEIRKLYSIKYTIGEDKETGDGN